MKIHFKNSICIVIALFFIIPTFLNGQSCRLDFNNEYSNYKKNEQCKNSFCTKYIYKSEVFKINSVESTLQEKYDVKFYHLDLDLSNNDVNGNVLMKATSLTSQLDTVILDLLNNLIVDSVKVSINNGPLQTTTFTHLNDLITIKLPSTVGLNQPFETKVYYHGTPIVSSFYNSGYFTGTGHKFSASPPYNAKYWYPCKQNLTDKADSSWFYITTLSSDKGISNGLLTNTVNLGTKIRWEWKSKYPIDFYLISFVVGSFNQNNDYWHPNGRTDSLLLSYYNYSPLNVKSVLQVYSDLFGLYPFYNEKLALATVNLGGGIENQTVISLGDGFGGVEEHEIAHQWFGDHVTCGSWKDVMLNEGFATWCESIYDEFTSTTPNASRMSHFSDNSSTTTVYGNMMDTTTVNGVFFNANIYYKKAAMVVNSLRFHINNDSLFFLGIRNYLSTFGGKTATAVDLKNIMESTTGIPLSDFFNQWYYLGGAPKFDIKWAQNPSKILFLQITQTTNSVTNPLYKTPVEIKIFRTQGDTIVRLFINSNVSNFNFYCSGNITGFEVDPNQWITNQLGTVTQDVTLNFQEQLTNNIYIYPNPAESILNIFSDGMQIENVSIFDLNGKLLKSLDFENTININDLKEGLYLIKLTHKQGVLVNKFIKL